MTYAKTIQSMTAHGSHLSSANEEKMVTPWITQEHFDRAFPETNAGDLSEADIPRIDEALGGDELKALSGNGRK